MEVPSDLVTPKEAARLLHCHLATLYRLVLSGKLPAWRRAGHRLLVSRADVLALLTPVEPRAPGPPLMPSPRAEALRDRHTEEVLRRVGLG